MTDGVTVECHRCGCEWAYCGDGDRATCPDCDVKTPVGGPPSTTHNWDVYQAARRAGK